MKSKKITECDAITRSGTKCKRKALPGKNYCYQHAPMVRKWGKIISVGSVILTVTLSIAGLLADLAGLGLPISLLPKTQATSTQIQPSLSSDNNQITPTSDAELLPEFKVLDRISTSRTAYDIFIKDHFAYIANGGDGLVVFDISTLSTIKKIGGYPLENARSVSVSKNMAYVAQEGIVDNGQQLKDRLVLININHPSNPTVVGYYEVEDIFNNIDHVTTNGNTAFITGHNFLYAIDVTVPSEPTLLFKWEPPANSGVPCNAAIVENILYVTAGWDGLFIFDVSDPAMPKKIGQFDTPDWITDIQVNNNIALLSLGEGGLITVDISDPSHPTLMGRLTELGYVINVSASKDEIAYATYFIKENDTIIENGLAAININDPYKLNMIAKYTDVEATQNISTDNNLVYVIDEYLGVLILTLETEN